MPVEACSEYVALEELGDAADVLDHLDAALHLAVRVGEHLAVLGREEAREVLAVLVEELVDAEEELGALRERPVAPRRERVAFAAATARSISSTDANATSPVCSPVAGL